MKKQIKISEETLKIIQTKEIKPIPKWEFMAKNWLLWMMILGSLILAAIGSSLSWFGLAGREIEPYLGLILAGVFAMGAYGWFEKTKKAYRIERWQVLTVIMVIGVVSGGIFYFSGIARNIDRGLEKTMPYYRDLAPVKVETWSQPENGRLSGKIEKILGNNRVEISDFEGKSWTVDYSQALVRGRVEMLVGEEIKIIGKMGQDGVFEAEEIRPWVGRHQN